MSLASTTCKPRSLSSASSPQATPAWSAGSIEAGHEVASHGWDHRRLIEMTPHDFLEDLERSKDTLEQTTGDAVHGYRAPTFSIVNQTAWAVDVLAEAGLRYDSSIFPVRHDRYGIPCALVAIPGPG